MPTYNFAVVVDDWDMRISHVFRGDEHVNNTPWQINIFRALGAPLPLFGHVPIILGDDGQKLSKRRGAVSVTAYEEAGYLPEAMLNYLARLGWSHGDDELFSARADGRSGSTAATSSKSPAQWDPAKLAWVNAHYLKALADDARWLALVARAAGAARHRRAAADEPLLRARCALFKDRCSTGGRARRLAGDVLRPTSSRAPRIARSTSPMPSRPALATLRDKLATAAWDKASASPRRSRKRWPRTA